MDEVRDPGASAARFRRRTWRPFEAARDFVRSLGLRNQRAWREWSRSGARPEDIPSTPGEVYAGQFHGFGDWLGTGAVAPRYATYRAFVRARAWARRQGFRTGEDWRRAQLPPDIPRTAWRVYAGQWKGLGDWLGTGRVANFDKAWRPFEEARRWARGLGLKSSAGWVVLRRAGGLPDDLPACPNAAYRRQWTGWGDFLGTGTIQTQRRRYKPFREARAFARALGLSSQREWKLYMKGELPRKGRPPRDLPVSPPQVWPAAWRGWGDWLGTGNVPNWAKGFRPFDEARAFARGLCLRTVSGWEAFCASGRRPADVPWAPDRSYLGRGWSGWGDFLGPSYRSDGRDKRAAREGAHVIHAPAETLERELARLAALAGNARRAAIVTERLGLGGHGRKKLVDVGARHGLTHERIRQVCVEARSRLEDLGPSVPLLDRALEEACAHVPGDAGEIEDALAGAGITAGPFDLSGLQGACELLGREAPFELARVAGHRIVVRRGESGLARWVGTTARMLVGRRGIASGAEVAARARHAGRGADARLVLAVLAARADFAWIDRDKGVFRLTSTCEGRVLLRVAKALSVAVRPVDVVRLHRAIRRDPRTGPCSAAQLHALVASTRWCSVDGRMVSALPSFDRDAALGGAERMLVAVLGREGALRRDELDRACCAAGMNRNTFAWHVLRSPVVERRRNGRYYLFGN